MTTRRIRRVSCAILIIGTGALLASCATQPKSASTSADPAPAAVASGLQPAVSDSSADYPVEWTDDAAAAFAAEVPKMVQKVARKGAEKKAREKGLHVIDMQFYAELKKEMNK
jgi:hypothetical protein